MADEEVKTEPQAAADGSIEIEVVPEKNLGKRLSDDEIAQNEVPDDEIARYNQEAQKRIRGLRLSNQEWKRRYQSSAQDLGTLTSMTEQLYRENQQLKQSVSRSDTAVIDQALQRSEAQLEQAKMRLQTAMANQDIAGQTAAYEEVARAVAEGDRLKLLKQPVPAANTPPAVPPPPAAPPPRQPVPESDRVRAWRSENPWFLKPGEEEMSAFALGVHEELKHRNINEVNNPEAYFSTIDQRLRRQFPDRFEKAAPAAHTPRPPTVTGSTRVNGGEPPQDRNKVVLTEREVRMARSIGVPIEEYAKQKLKYQDELKERQNVKVTVQ